MDRAEKAVEFKRDRQRHNNCCQAVLMAFADQVDLDEDQLRKLGAGFGGGMGNMEGTCGALVAAEMLVGLMKFDQGPVRRDARQIQESFTKQCGASLCKDLKGVTTGTMLCDCDDCVRAAVRLVEAL